MGAVSSGTLRLSMVTDANARFGVPSVLRWSGVVGAVRTWPGTRPGCWPGEPGAPWL